MLCFFPAPSPIANFHSKGRRSPGTGRRKKRRTAASGRRLAARSGSVRHLRKVYGLGARRLKRSANGRRTDHDRRCPAALLSTSLKGGPSWLRSTGSLHRAAAADVWDALRDVGALHTRLAVGFVTDGRMEPGARVVTFANGVVARELIVAVDDASPASGLGGRGRRDDSPQRLGPGLRGRHGRHAGSSG